MRAIRECLIEHARRTPDAPAVLAPGGRPPLSYRRLAAQVQYVGERLAAAGVGPRDRVAAVLPEGAETAVTALAVAANAAYAPLNPAYAASEFEARLAVLRPKAMLVPHGGDSPALTAARAMGVQVIEVVSQPAASAGVATLVAHGAPGARHAGAEAPSADDVALLLFTSGTAARPKLVPLTQRNLLASARNIGAAIELTPADVCLGVMPLFHIHGLSTLLATIVSGGSYVGTPPGGFSTEQFFASVQEFRPTWYSASPTIHRMILDEANRTAEDPGLRGGLRLIRSASAPMPPRLIADIETAFGVPFVEAYGMTEAAPQIASNRLPPHPRKPGSVGRAAGPDVAIMDDAGALLAPGKTGEVVVRGENVTAGYDGDPDATAAAFTADGWFRTGDLGSLDADGFLFVTGRIKDVINRGGEKVSPRRVDDVLTQHPAVAEAAAFGVAHPLLGEDVAAAITLKLSHRGADANREALVRDVREFAVSRLVQFEVPRRIIVVDQIPHGPTGKPIRADLARIFRREEPPAGINAESTSPDRDRTPPRTPAERRVAQAFAEVLKIDGVPGAHADFFDLGGHSLSATQVLGRLEQAFQVPLPVDAIFRHPTPARLAAMIAGRIADLVADGAARLDRRGAAGVIEIAPVETAQAIRRRPDPSGPAPLSFAQERAYFMDQLGARGAYNMAASLWLAGPLDAGVLQRCLAQIVARHESLRTTFEMRDGRPVQLVSELESPMDLPLVDLASVAACEREGEALRIATEFAERPFDLARGPLFRVTLLRLDAARQALLLGMHHIASDGWSVGVLYREFAACYAAAVSGREPVLPELRFQYADFAAWQRERVRGGELNAQLAYWTGQLRDAPPACGFPADRPRPPVQTYRGATRQASFARPLADRLRVLARREDVTEFMVYLAAFKALLFRYNGQDDCVVGTPIANRPTADAENLIGFFANTLALRTSLAGEPTFADLLGRVRETALGAYANQDVPLERIVDELRLPRDLARTPLFQVMFAFQSVPGGDAEDGSGAFALGDVGLTARPFRADSGTAKFDLTLYLTPSADGVAATWQYNADLFDGETIERLSRHFQNLLEAVAADASVPVSRLPLLDAGERRRIEVEWNRTEAGRAPARCFLELFGEHVARSPDAEAVVGPDGVLTYRQLDERADGVAACLKSAGVVPGALAGVCLGRSAEFAVMLLGVWKAGAALLPLDPEYPAERIAFMLRDAGVAMLVSDGRIRATLRSSIGVTHVVCVDDMRAASSDEAARPDVAADALAYVIYTSGSTGTPKGVAVTHGNVGHYAPAMADAVGIEPTDRYLHTASFAFSSSIRQFVVPLSVGATVVIASADAKRDPLALFELVRRERVSVIDLVPSFWAACNHVLSALPPAECRELLANDLRLILSASEPLPANVPRDWARLGGRAARVVNMCGQTETTGICTTCDVPVADAFAPGAVVPIGRPVARTQAYVLDAAGQTAPVGVWGELHIGGAGVGRGYVSQPELTARQLLPDPFSADPAARLYRTGDVARRRADGVLEIAGRADQQVKVRGFRIEPGEVEAVARSHPSVDDCVVAAFNGTGTSPKHLAAFVVPRAGGNGEAASLPASVRELLRRKLPEYMVPQAVVTVARMPRTPTGKVDRAALAALLPHAAPTDASPVAARPARQRVMPQTRTERTLAQVWQKVLRLDAAVGADENFFDLGGNSLLSLSVLVEAKQAGLHMTLAQLYQNQTVGELSRVVTEFRVGQQLTEVPVATTPTTPPKAAMRPASPAVADDPASVLVTIESCRAYGREALARAGLIPEGAAVVTEVQLEASIRGQPTHNMVSIPRYAKRVATGKLNGHPRIRVEHETPSTARVDGDNGPGQWVATVAMDLAIAKARQTGIGMVGVRRSNHFGAAGHFAGLAASAGFIGLCTTNGPLILAPTGGATPTFGNNPIGVGIPAGTRHAPIVLDIAMSVAPRGRIGLFVAEGKSLPEGWILDRLGRPSTDLADLAAGLGVPIGGHKGYGLAFVMETLAGVLSGAGFCADHRREKLHGTTAPPDYGHFFMVVDPKLFMPAAEFAQRVDHLIEQTKSGELAEGSAEILVPGEMEHRARERSLREGVRLRPSTYRALVTYGQDAGLRAELELVSGGVASVG